MKNLVTRYMAVLLFMVTILSRLPFVSHFLYNWDSVQYALGTLDFSIIHHQPHPPGYILYMATGKLLNLLTGNPNMSFVILSLLASGLAMIAFYLFALDVGGKEEALYASLLLLFNPVFWFCGEIVSTYTIECFFATVIAWLCFRIRKKGERDLAPWVGLFLAIAGGVRQTTLFLLAPVALFALHRVGWRDRAKALILFLIISLAWLAPLIYLSGGLEDYLFGTRQLAKVDTISWHYEGWRAVLQNFRGVLLGTVCGLNILTPVLIVFLLRFFSLLDKREPWQRRFVLLWIVPSVVFFSTFHFGQLGYILIFLPAILVYAPPIVLAFVTDFEARIQKELGLPALQTKMAAQTLLTLAAAINIAFYLFVPWETSAQAIRGQDAKWDKIMRLMDDFAPDQTIILTEFLTTGAFRHASYYLPEYPVYCIGADDEVGVYGWLFLAQHHNRSYNLNQLKVYHGIPISEETHYVLILDEVIAQASLLPLSEIPLDSNYSLYLFTLEHPHPPQELIFLNHRLDLR